MQKEQYIKTSTCPTNTQVAAYFNIVQVLHSQERLSEIVANFRFGQGFSSLVEFHEGPSPTQLQQNVHVVFVLKEPVESNNVWVA